MMRQITELARAESAFARAQVGALIRRMSPHQGGGQ